MPTHIRCSHCTYTRSWLVRRGARKCKRCRREFRPYTYPVSGIRSTYAEWKYVLEVFVRRRAARCVVEDTGTPYCRVASMLRHVRACLVAEKHIPFTGICEADETFIGGQRKNKRLHIRRKPCKRGHGTEKTPIVGVYSRSKGQVAVRVLTHRNDENVLGFMASCLAPGATLYTDGYKMNRGITRYGYTHKYVDHDAGEYVRGDIHTNSIEGFWGYLKRYLATIGGIRRENLPAFVAEIVWRYNHRHLTASQQADRLYELICRE